jgi:uncharacterized protein YecT (DUF1311 family)
MPAALAGILFLSLLLAAANALPADCQHPRSQLDLNRCGTQQYERVNQQMGQVYMDYRERLTAMQKEQLRNVQQAWLQFRDLTCGFESSAALGASVHGVVLQSCLTARTRMRLQELQALANCREGDLSCPAPRPPQ